MENNSDDKKGKESNPFFENEIELGVDALSIEQKLSRIIDIQRELDLRKELFAEYDLLVMSLAKSKFGKAYIGGLVVELKDNFDSKNTSFTTAAIKRYEVEIVSKELNAKREAKKAKG